MQSMDWNDITYFLAVAEQGSLSGAAQKLAVNHSTVFRRINALESKLGARLFERLPNGYRLTELGDSALRHAQDAHDAMHSFERTIVGRDYQLTGVVRVTAPPSMVSKYLAPCAAGFHKEYPGIQLDIVTSDAINDLSKREADIALRATNNPPEHLIGRKIREHKWQVFASKEYLSKHSRPTSMSELADHALIGADESLSRIEIYQWLAQKYPSQCFTHRGSNISIISELCAQGLGLAVLPEDYTQRELIPLFPVEPTFKTQLWILMHPDLRSVLRIRIFSDFLFNYLKA